MYIVYIERNNIPIISLNWLVVFLTNMVSDCVSKKKHKPIVANLFFYNIILMFQTLPDQSHCYFLSDHDSLNGYVVKKIPFSHPAQVPRILATLKKQAVFNSILSSCIRTSGIQGNVNILISINIPMKIPDQLVCIT